MNKKCIGCGATMQTTNPEEVGYIKKEKYQDGKYCERCFKINNYNLKSITNLNNINEYIMKEINKKSKYVYFMVDLLNVNNETINTFKRIKTNKTLVISKLDSIPKSIKCNSITNWLREVYGIEERVIYQSSKKNLHTSEIVNSIENSKEKEVYIVGYTNSGKSSLINTLIKDKEKITTSNNLNTTVDFIKIKRDGITIIDSPGFVYEKTIYNPDEYDLIRRTNPREYLKPRTYQTKNNHYLEIEDKVAIKTESNNSLTFYVSNDINLNKIYLDKPNKLINEEEIEIEVNDNVDLVIKSIGFINIKKKDKLKIRIKERDLIEIRPSIFK